MALTRVGAGRNLTFIIYSLATCLKQKFIYSCDIPNERVWSQLGSELFIIIIWLPYVDKMAHFNIYFPFVRIWQSGLKYYANYLIWHKCNRHRTLSLYLMVLCKCKPFLWYKNYHIIFIQSWDIVGWTWMGATSQLKIYHNRDSNYGLHTPHLHHLPHPHKLNHTNLFWSLQVSWKRFHLLIEKI